MRVYAEDARHVGGSSAKKCVEGRCLCGPAAPCVLVLLGAVSASPNLTWAQVGDLMCVAICFNIYGFVLNDVLDVRLDRTEPRRAQCPLVSGTLTRRQAAVLSLVPIPAILVLTAVLDGDARAYAAYFARVSGPC